MAKSGMNPKTLQYLMGHSDISVTMNVYTHIGFDDAEEELKRMEDLQNARKELEQTRGEKLVSQRMFKGNMIIEKTKDALRLQGVFCIENLV